MIKVVWQMGEPALRSCPADRPNPAVNQHDPAVNQHDPAVNQHDPAVNQHDLAVNQQQSSLPDETLTPQKLPASASVIDREMCSTKLHSRPLAPGVSHAPFASETDYVTGLTNEEMYLRPKSSHDQKQPVNLDATA